MDVSTLRDDLVTAMLAHAAFDGWSKAAMAAAADDLGLDPSVPARVFPGGPAEAVAHFVALADRLMAEDLAALTLGRGVGEKVFQAVKLRLGRWEAHREAIRRAASVLALPGNLALATRLTWGTADAIWHAIGDTAHDFSWYTKRATLSAVYSATLFYWLDDDSEGQAASWAFLRRRLDDVRRLPQLRQKLAGMLKGGGLGGLARGLKPPARRWGLPTR